MYSTYNTTSIDRYIAFEDYQRLLTSQPPQCSTLPSSTHDLATTLCTRYNLHAFERRERVWTMIFTRPWLAVAGLSLLSTSASAKTHQTAFGIETTAPDGFTYKHEAGRCAIRGHCGKQGFFGSDLPCPDNGLAEEPTASTRKTLMSICGDKWAEGPVCCTDE